MVKIKEESKHNVTLYWFYITTFYSIYQTDILTGVFRGDKKKDINIFNEKGIFC
jgi:hypothetical protein